MTKIQLKVKLLNEQEEIETAISQVLKAGQAYTLDGTSYTRANLAELNKMLKEKKQELNKVSSPSRRVQTFNFNC